MPKIVDHEEVRQRIVDNAVSVFASKGYYSTNIIDIANKAGISRTAIYQYYNNKDQIFFQVVELIVDLLRREVILINSDDSKSRIDTIKDIIAKVLYTFSKNQELAIILIEIRMMFNKENSHLLTQQIRIYLKDLFDLIKLNIDKAIKHGEIKVVDSHSSAYMILLLLQSYLLDCGINQVVSVEQFISNFEMVLDCFIKKS